MCTVCEWMKEFHKFEDEYLAVCRIVGGPYIGLT